MGYAYAYTFMSTCVFLFAYTFTFARHVFACANVIFMCVFGFCAPHLPWGSIARTEVDAQENSAALVAQAVIATITPVLPRVCTGL